MSWETYRRVYPDIDNPLPGFFALPPEDPPVLPFNEQLRRLGNAVFTLHNNAWEEMPGDQLTRSINNFVDLNGVEVNDADTNPLKLDKIRLFFRNRLIENKNLTYRSRDYGITSTYECILVIKTDENPEEGTAIDIDHMDALDPTTRIFLRSTLTDKQVDEEDPDYQEDEEDEEDEENGVIGDVRLIGWSW